MIHYRRFYKEPSGCWYIDLPEYIDGGYGTKANLLMVAGADTFLDVLARGKREVTVLFAGSDIEAIRNLQHIFDYEHTKFTKSIEDLSVDGEWQSIVDAAGEEYEYGATYSINYINTTVSPKEVDKMWLCPVTSYVFEGVYPNKIYSVAVNNGSLLARLKPQYRDTLLANVNKETSFSGTNSEILHYLISKSFWTQLPIGTVIEFMNNVVRNTKDELGSGEYSHSISILEFADCFEKP